MTRWYCSFGESVDPKRVEAFSASLSNRLRSARRYRCLPSNRAEDFYNVHPTPIGAIGGGRSDVRGDGRAVIGYGEVEPACPGRLGPLPHTRASDRARRGWMRHARPGRRTSPHHGRIWAGQLAAHPGRTKIIPPLRTSRQRSLSLRRSFVGLGESIALAGATAGVAADPRLPVGINRGLQLAASTSRLPAPSKPMSPPPPCRPHRGTLVR
jgi:hypothetical protein